MKAITLPLHEINSCPLPNCLPHPYQAEQGGFCREFLSLVEWGSLKDFSFVTAVVLTALCEWNMEPHCSFTRSGHSGLLHVCHQMGPWLRDWGCSAHLVGWTTWNCQHSLFLTYKNGNLMWFNWPVSDAPPLLSFYVPPKKPHLTLWRPFFPSSPVGIPCRTL